MCADYAHDLAVRFVHNERMDIEWFRERKRALKINDTAVGAAIGRDRSIANRLVNGKLPFDVKFVEGLATVFKVTRQEILARAGVLDADTMVVEQNATPFRLEGASLELPRGDFPIVGTGLGAAKQVEGYAIEQTTLNRADVIEHVKRPTMLNGVRDAYGLYVQGSSMHPKLPDGEMLAVTTRGPISIGDDVVVYLRPENPEDDDGKTARAVLVKELVRRTASHVELRQYSPAADFKVEMKDVIRIDRVLTRKEMMS